MARYIDADRIIAQAHLWHTPQEAYRDIILAPSADVRKNTKARLIVKAEGLTHYYICDQCGASIDPEDNFCRKCGAEIGG